MKTVLKSTKKGPCQLKYDEIYSISAWNKGGEKKT